MIARLVRGHVAQPVPAALAVLTIAPLFVTSDATFAAVTIAPLLFIVSRSISPRPSPFEMALPVRGREVMIARALATLALVLLPITVALIRASLAESRDALSLLLGCTALGVAAVLLPYHVNRGSLQPAPTRDQLIAWGALAGVGAAILLLLPPSLAATLLVLGAVLSVAALWITIPDALQRASASSRDDDTSSALATRDQTHDVVNDVPRPGPVMLRAVMPGRLVLLVPLFVIAGAFNPSLFMFSLGVLVVHNIVRAHSRWLAALPFSHRTRLMAVVLPSVVAAVVLFGLGAALPISSLRWRDSLHDDAPSTITPADHWYASPTRVSVDHWRRVRGESPPVITAPWGEAVPADTARLLGVPIYNPYTTLEHSSARFVAWQFARVTNAVYGRMLTQAQYDTMQAFPRRDTGTLRGWLVSASALATLALLVVLLAELPYSPRAREGTILGRVAPFLAMIPGFLFIPAELALRVRDAHVATSLLNGGLRAIAAALPANPLAALLIAAVPVMAAYALVERQFRRSEAALLMKEGTKSS